MSWLSRLARNETSEERWRPRAATAFARVGTALAITSMGALGLGAVAVGALAIRALAVKRARIQRLEIDELIVGGQPSRPGRDGRAGPGARLQARSSVSGSGERPSTSTIP